MTTLVIIHGWSDDSESFEALAQAIIENTGGLPIGIRLGDWISMNDDVTLADVASALQEAWRYHQLPFTARSVDLVVHSTGALVVREWMTRFYSHSTVPIHRLLMLAPANFGSPLAHKGRSFIGRAFKGWGEPGFQTGRRILKSLEIASPYTFDLAHKDLFNVNERWYGLGGILCTVLVGNTGYRGVAAIANEEGSDGTVRISTANLNASKVKLKLDAQNNAVSFEVQSSNADVAFGIVEKENHSTIALKGRKLPSTVELIIGALNVQDEDWPLWKQKLSSKSNNKGEADQFQNTVIYLRDNLGNEVTDYFVEFYRTNVNDRSFEQRLYTQFIRSVHVYEDNPCYRSMYLDIGVLDKIKQALRSTENRSLYLSFLAMPRYVPSASNQSISLNPVGYRPVGEYNVAGLSITIEQLPLLFSPHRTLLVEAQIHRAIDDNVFRMLRIHN